MEQFEPFPDPVDIVVEPVVEGVKPEHTEPYLSPYGAIFIFDGVKENPQPLRHNGYYVIRCMFGEEPGVASLLENQGWRIVERLNPSPSGGGE